MSSAGFEQVPDDLVTDSLTVQCVIGEDDPELCDGWCTTVEIDPGGVRVNGYGQIFFPDEVPRECPECGDQLLRFNGVAVSFHA